MAPGERQELTVALENYGSEPAEVLTFAADAYTLINGGFAGRLAEDPTHGPTKWLDYEPESLTLAAQKAVNRSFTVEVPEDAKPGDYVSSLVIQTAEPVRGQGDIAIDQVLRQVIAVAVDVPGERTPELTIGDATYNNVGAYSSVMVAVENGGNAHLSLAGELRLQSAQGRQLVETSLTLGTFLAGTETSVEVPLEEPLPPGEYTVALSLADEELDLTVSEESLPITVAPEVMATPEAPPPPPIAIEAVTINESRDPQTEALQFVEGVVKIANPGEPVGNCQLTLRVERDGELVEELVLGTDLDFPGGTTEYRQRYLPIDGWQPGTYTFAVTLDQVDRATGTVTTLATATADTTVTVD